MEKRYLENNNLAICFDNYGRLLSFSNKRTGHNYAGQEPVWRLYLQVGNQLDVEVNANSNDMVPEVSQPNSRTLVFHWSALSYIATAGLSSERKSLAISLTIKIWIPDSAQTDQADSAYWAISISNNEPSIILQESHFPLIKGLQLAPKQKLIWSQYGGERIDDIKEELNNTVPLYMAPDHLFRGKTLGYPFPAATNCYTFAGEEESLYLGCHGNIGERTLHQIRLYSDNQLESGFVHFPRLEHGNTFEGGPYVTAICHGGWHLAAHVYQDWARSWFRNQQNNGTFFDPPGWLRRMNGWQRIIMQHQYGDIHYRFEDIPAIYADGIASGIDTLFIFGWQRGGHDNNYPDYTPDPKIGGLNAMRDGFNYFKKKNGRIILYANGRLIDRNSDFYKELGHRISIKDVFGNEIREAYKFRGPGNYVYEYANRTVVPACPSCEEWYEVLKKLADDALEWGCDSLFFDQIGTDEYPCCDPQHNHPKLWKGSINAKAETMRRIREYLHSKNSEVALGIELISDITAQHVDYIHTQIGGCALSKEQLKSDQKPQSRDFLEWFRYMFPEIIISDREIRDDTDIERRVNHAVMLGLRSDVEIYRCRRTITTTPRYASYLKEINLLRERNSTILLEGRYNDTLGFSTDSDDVDARSFDSMENEATFGIVVTQSHRPEATITLHPHNSALEYQAVDGVGEFSTKQTQGNAIQVTLKRHAIAVVVFSLKTES